MISKISGRYARSVMLLFMLVALTAAAVVEWTENGRTMDELSREIRPTPDATTPASGHDNATSQVTSISQFREFARRPLFLESRRPQASRPTAGGAVSEIVLLGVVVTDDQRFALLRANDSHEPPALVRKGQKYRGFVVAEIGTSGVVLERAGRDYEIKLVVRSTAPSSVKRPSKRVGKEKTSASGPRAADRRGPVLERDENSEPR
jgi:hypothetical protein